MTVKAQVSEADVSKLKIGMDAYFTLLGQPGKRYTGKLRQIQPTPDIENNVVLYYALFDVPNPDGDLMISMSAQVFFVQSAAKNVLVVPSAAVQQPGVRAARAADGAGHKAEVTVVTPPVHQETREVEVGIRNRVSAEIKSGLKEGELVVVGQGANWHGASDEPCYRQSFATRHAHAADVLNAMTAIISLKDISKTYHNGDLAVEVLHGISLDIEAGEFVAIIGAIRLGQVDADEYSRLSRPADERRLSARRRTCFRL